ncbi:hypothetical protein DR950_17990 [Kitasatospora xanthocidica]|uniref:DUF5753 domain-containing protein n=1 Tax=Kitasatospora xanthocidica TaxID=83382 RepID=A0A372ZVH9_9ACTN|nr:DUF5753 domain-containing protein [Kitasatospora xanthocidica]RGD59432.1 hypothetical protein DR950_17990 [Kitasatospora xanthocidica]
MSPTAAIALEPIQASILELHRNASTIHTYSPGIIPGTLQTEDYARAIFTSVGELHRAADHDIEAAIQARMARRELIDETRQFEYILNEHALTNVVAAPAVHSEQLHLLLDCMERPGLTVGIVPDEVPLRAHWGFTIVNEVRVELDQYQGPHTVTEPENVQRFRKAFRRLRDTAVLGDDARTLISALI